VVIKNRAVTGFTFMMLDKKGEGVVENGTLNGYVTIDGGDQTAIEGDIIHKGNGEWAVNLTADETNGDTIGLTFTHPDAFNVHFTISTRTPAAGAGAITWAYTLTDSTTGLPIADADLWVTTDSVGLNIIAQGKTDQNGVTTFYLDAGTVYVWRSKSGYSFTNPDTEVVA
jgi:hypothetical protein